MRTGQEDSKFGFSVSSGAAAEAVAALELLPGVELVGVHAHIGSQVFDASSFERAAEVLGAFFAPLGLPELVVGGGLGVPYVNGESAPTRPSGRRPRVPRAPRRASIPRRGSRPSRAGPSWPRPASPSTRVGTVKHLPGHPHLRERRRRDERQPAAGPLRQRVRGLPAAGRRRARPRPVRVVGKHCESGDLVVPDAFVPDDLEVGDVLATPVTGAYGYSMASNYNKVPRPAVVFVRGRHRPRGRAPRDVRGPHPSLDA